MKRLFSLWIVPLLLTVFAGCAQVGLAKPESLEDQLRYGQAGVSAAYKTIGDLKSQGAISTDQGISMFKRAETMERDLAAGEALLKVPGGSGAASSKITLALQALTVLQAELRARQKTSMMVPDLLGQQLRYI